MAQGGATDPAANDNIVLTNDTVGYEVEYTVNNTPLPLLNVVLVFDLPRHPGDPLTGIPANTPYASWSGGVALPSGCVLSSTTVGGVTAANQRATCTFASISAVGNNFLPFRAQTNPQMVNNTVMPSPIATATWQGKVGGPKPADVTSVDVTMKAGGDFNARKGFQAPLTSDSYANWGSNRRFVATSGPSGEDGFFVWWPIEVAIDKGASAAGDRGLQRIGAPNATNPLLSDFALTDNFTGDTKGMRLVTWPASVDGVRYNQASASNVAIGGTAAAVYGPCKGVGQVFPGQNGTSGNHRDNYFAYDRGPFDVNSSGYVFNGGTCTATDPGNDGVGPINISITGVNTAQTVCAPPTTFSASALRCPVSSKQLLMWFPMPGITTGSNPDTTTLGANAVTNCLTSPTSQDVTGNVLNDTVATDNCGTRTFTLSPTGVFSKFYYGFHSVDSNLTPVAVLPGYGAVNTANNATVRNSPRQMLPNQQFFTMLDLTNSGTVPLGQFYCDKFDNRYLRVVPDLRISVVNTSTGTNVTTYAGFGANPTLAAAGYVVEYGVITGGTVAGYWNYPNTGGTGQDNFACNTPSGGTSAGYTVTWYPSIAAAEAANPSLPSPVAVWRVRADAASSPNTALPIGARILLSHRIQTLAINAETGADITSCTPLVNNWGRINPTGVGTGLSTNYPIDSIRTPLKIPP